MPGFVARLREWALIDGPGGLDRGDIASNVRNAALDLLEKIVKEGAEALKASNYGTRVEDVCDFGALLALSPEIRALVIVRAFRHLDEDVNALFWVWGKSERCRVSRTIASRLLRADLPLTTSQLKRIVYHARRTTSISVPYRAIVHALERHVERNGTSDALRPALRVVRIAIQDNRFLGAKDKADLLRRIGPLADEAGHRPFLSESKHGNKIDRWLEGFAPGPRVALVRLLYHAAGIGGGRRPSKKWREAMRPLVETVGGEVFRDALVDLMEMSLSLYPDRRPLAPQTVKGLLWAAADMKDAGVVRAVAGFAERSFRPEPGFWQSTDALGTVALHVLAAMPDLVGVAELTKLRNRLRRPPIQTRIEQALDTAAERAGISAGAVEERAIPDFGLDGKGVATTSVGDFEAEIRVTGSTSVALNWRTADGHPRKGVPAAVNRDHPEVLAELRDNVKQIKQMLAGQSARIERAFIEERRWSVAEWRRYYVDHPLVGGLTRRLIWNVEQDGRMMAALPRDGGLLGAGDMPIELDEARAAISLWHPMDASVDETMAWRRRLDQWGVVQPFKQAHREVYILTDAECETETYSNRFAAHIIRQNPFSRLCQQRGWRYALQGLWDSHNTPTRRLSQHDVALEFLVDPVETGDELDYIYTYLVTNQLQFTDLAGAPKRLVDIPPRVFSEALRDLDLFVSVCSIGNDPTWVDAGPHNHNFPYWEAYSFGNLLESGRMRREALNDIIPKLGIAEQCTMSDRFLVVRGNRHTYKIHLGSSNVMMEPGSRYLCIVPDKTKSRSTNGIKLPFEGDSMLSIILSKAFFLANDDKITDTSTLSQIDRR